MKLLVLKLASLILLTAGVVWLGYLLEFAPLTAYVEQLPAQIEVIKSQLPPGLSFAERLLDPGFLKLAGAVFFLVAGLYGFLPRLPKGTKNRKVQFNGSHGEVEIQLESVQATLNTVLARMPEVRKIQVKVTPTKDKRRAVIHADVVLEHQSDKSARETASLVTDYIAETATTVLGLEELADIKLNIQGIHVNPKKSSAAIRDEHSARLAASTALPAPPDAIDTRGRSVEAPEELEDTTDNTPHYSSHLEPLASAALAPKVSEPLQDPHEAAPVHAYEPVVEAAPAASPFVAEETEEDSVALFQPIEEAEEAEEEAYVDVEVEEDALDTEETQDSLLGFGTDRDISAEQEQEEDERTAFGAQPEQAALDEETDEQSKDDTPPADPAPKRRWGW
ncbi:MAG: hypothetical protein HYV27_16680 [Candidatus Hydrogenedentes bacterium]|nr:hypothetical protein [Candidatus Hydrogenedentota bacterium]